MVRTSIAHFALPTLFLAACSSPPPSANSTAIPDNGAVATAGAGDGSYLGDSGAATAAASAWTLSSVSDPMSGNVVETASMKIQGQTFDIEATVKCVSGRALSYQFNSFDKAGQPARMVTQESQYWGLGIPYEERIDDKPPRRQFANNLRYNNQVAFPSGPNFQDEGKADQLVLRFFMQQGEETIVLDQTDTGLRSVLDACAGTNAKPSSAGSAGQSPRVQGSGSAPQPSSEAIPPDATMQQTDPPEAYSANEQSDDSSNRSESQ